MIPSVEHNYGRCNHEDQGDRNFYTTVYVPKSCINEGTGFAVKS